MSSPSTHLHLKLPEIVAHLEALGLSASDADSVGRLVTDKDVARQPTQSPHVTNTMVVIPSQKMRRTVTCESLGIEYIRALQLEFDPNVLWYCEQPTTLDNPWTNSAGRNCRSEPYHPDFLVIARDGVWFEETKSVTDLERKLAKPQKRWTKDANGTYHYGPGESNIYGIPYRVVTDETLTRRAIRNFGFLMAGHTKRHDPTLSDAEKFCCPLALDRIKQAFRLTRCYTIADLGEEAGVELLDIYRAIGQGELFFLIDDELLSEPHRCHVFRNVEHAQAAKYCKSPLPTIRIRTGVDIPIGNETFKVLSSNGKALKVLVNGDVVDLNMESLPQDTLDALMEQSLPSSGSIDGFTDRMMSEGMERLAAINIFEQSETLSINPKTGKAYSRRTLNRWLRQLDSGRAAGLSDLDSVMPRRIGQGRRSDSTDPNPLMHPDVQELMDKHLTGVYLQRYAPSLAEAWRRLNAAIGERWPNQGREVSYSSFRTRLRAKWDRNQIIRAREGYRRGNANTAAFGPISGEKPMIGEYAFDVVDMDHTLADQTAVVVIGENGYPLPGKLMLTVMLDTYSRMPLAWAFTHDLEFGEGTKGKGDKLNRASGARAALLIRDLIKKHGRMPTRLHVDGGSDFSSEALERLLRMNGCIKSRRPPSDPKKGPLVERFFASINDALFHQIPGGRRHHGPRHLRDVPKGHLGDEHAAFTMSELNAMFDIWMTEIYPHQEHTGICKKPAQAFAEGLAKQPEVIQIQETDELLDLLLSVEEKYESVVEVDGVRFGGDHFNGPTLQNSPKFYGQRVKLRTVAWDDSFVFALLDGRWERLISNLRVVRSLQSDEDRRVEAERRAIEKGRSRKDRRYGDKYIRSPQKMDTPVFVQPMRTTEFQIHEPDDEVKVEVSEPAETAADRGLSYMANLKGNPTGPSNART